MVELSKDGLGKLLESARCYRKVQIMKHKYYHTRVSTEEGMTRNCRRPDDKEVWKMLCFPSTFDVKQMASPRYRAKKMSANSRADGRDLD